MQLALDHQQRLNLINLLDSLDCKGREIFAVHDLQASLDLNVEEKEAIEFREEVVNGQAGYRWNPTKVLAPKVFLFSDVDANRIERALEKYEKLLAEWEGDTIAGQFRWLRLVRAQMTTNGNGNGAKP